MVASPPSEQDLVESLVRFLPGMNVAKDDPILPHTRQLQQMRWLSVRPEDRGDGVRVLIRVTKAGYAALGRSAPASRSGR